MLSEELQARLDSLPTAPGCYVFKNKKGGIIYVGKAKSLRARVRQYFQPGSSDYRYFVPLLERTRGHIAVVSSGSGHAQRSLAVGLMIERPRRESVLQ